MEPVERFLLDPEPLTPAMLGLTSQSDLEERIGDYLTIAGATDTPTEPQRQQVLALIYGARIAVLEGKADKFRAEGDITTERDVMARIARLERLRAAAEAASQAAETGGAVTEAFLPTMEPWGVG